MKIKDALILDKDWDLWGKTDKKIKKLSAWAVFPENDKGYGITLFGRLPNGKSLQIGIEEYMLVRLLDDINVLKWEDKNNDF